MHSEDSLPTGLQLTVMDDVFRETPHRHLDVLRTRDPVHQDKQLNRLVLTRAVDVADVLKDRSHSVDRNSAAPGSFAAMVLAQSDLGETPSMLFLDDPKHKRLRSLVTQAFNARAVEAIRPHIAEIADSLLDALEGKVEFDLIEAYASPLPVIVIAEMLGVDPADRAQFRRWSKGTAQSFNPVKTPEMVAALKANAEALSAYFQRAIDDRRENPRADLISAMLAAELDGDRLSDAEIVVMCNLLLVAGNVTTTDLIGNAVNALLSNPAQLAKIKADPTRLLDAVEETLRFDPPVSQALRTVTTDREVAGVALTAGSSVMPMLIAAGHDPALHADPHNFDLDRTDKSHFAFGGGAHFCLGAPLAKAEAEIAIARLFARYPDLARAGAPGPRNMAPAFNGFSALRVRTG
jgi:cytochrome P450